MIPWRLRYGIKYLEAKTGKRLPLKYTADSENYYDAFFRMLDYMGVKDLEGKTVCEPGPGQKLTHAPLIWQLGGNASFFLDIGDLAGGGGLVSLDRYTCHPEGRELKKSFPKSKTMRIGSVT